MTARNNTTREYNLSNRTVAILATNGFEESELTSPRSALKAAGATVKLVSVKDSATTIRGWSKGRWSDDALKVDGIVPDMRADHFDALVLPGGVLNPDALRMNSAAVGFIRDFITAGKPVAAICHAPSLLVEAGVVKGRRLTSYPSIRTDLKNAGATWVDEAVVVDQGLVTSRTPEDLSAFNAKMLEEIAEGVHEKQVA
jgi:protease I